jgi:predicted  nucleic acid-binding Zn-ribbon protein
MKAEVIGMTELQECLVEIGQLEARRALLMVRERLKQAAYMAEEDEDEAKRIVIELQDICGEIDEIGNKIEAARARLVSHREKIMDVAYGGSL